MLVYGGWVLPKLGLPAPIGRRGARRRSSPGPASPTSTSGAASPSPSCRGSWRRRSSSSARSTSRRRRSARTSRCRSSAPPSPGRSARSSGATRRPILAAYALVVPLVARGRRRAAAARDRGAPRVGARALPAARRRRRARPTTRSRTTSAVLDARPRAELQPRRRARGGAATRHGRRSAQSAIAPCSASRLPVEEVVGAGDDDDLARRGERLRTRARSASPGPNSSFSPWTKRRGWRTSATGAASPPRAGRAGSRGRRRRGPVASRAATRRATAEPNEKPPRTSGSAGEAALHLEERRPRVLLLAGAVVVDALAAADAAEVEAEDGEAGRLQRLRGAEDDLEVHHPAVERVRVADDRRRDGRRPRAA